MVFFNRNIEIYVTSFGWDNKNTNEGNGLNIAQGTAPASHGLNRTAIHLRPPPPRNKGFGWNINCSTEMTWLCKQLLCIWEESPPSLPQILLQEIIVPKTFLLDSIKNYQQIIYKKYVADPLQWLSRIDWRRQAMAICLKP